MTTAAAEPFNLHVPDHELEDLQDRLDRTRWADTTAELGWKEGPSLDYVKDLVGHWLTEFDWRRHEAEINVHPHYRAAIDGRALHFLHVHGEGSRRVPLLLIHGWPSTFYEYLPLIPLLTRPIDGVSFDLVIPSLPGYGFSDPLPPGEFARVAEMLTNLMTDTLGYERFGAYGADIGGMVTNRLALEAPDRLLGISTSFPAEPYTGDGAPALSEEERRFVQRHRFKHYESREGYLHLGRNQPQLMTFALNDSPAGLAAHIIYFFREWSDCGGDIEKVFSKNQLLVTTMLYWISGSIATSYRSLVDWALGSASRPEVWRDRPEVPSAVDSKWLAPGERIDVPTQILLFSHRPPREWIDRAYADVRRFTPLDGIGHFGGLESPRPLAEELRAFFKEISGPHA
jgi:pimeloyl-ACP methyl ester carboxylesterase